MMPENNAKLEKLKIHVYRTIERSEANKIGIIEVMFNPTTYSQRYGNQFSKSQGINTSGTEATYLHTDPQDLNLELIIDGTNTYKNAGATAAPALITVKDRVKQFIDLTVSMVGATHQPPFLKIQWGDLTQFDYRLGSVDITYSLFDRAGNPLRATLKTHFISDISNTKRVSQENKNSPDLTHSRVVTSCNNLPLLVQEIYQNPLLYIQVAQANRLDNFRAINPGSSLLFPPIQNN